MSVRGGVMDTSCGGVALPAAINDGPHAGTSRRAWVGLGGLLLMGLAISTAAAHTASLLPESIRPAPAQLAGPLGRSGINLHVGGAIAALVIMFACYAAVVSAVSEISPRVVIGAIVALGAFVLLAPPLFSTDLFSYQAYARMGARYAINPYLHGPYAIRLDPVFPYVGAKWSYIPSAYGPVFTAFSYLLAPLSIAGSVIAYKSIAVAASFALVAILWRCARLRGTDPVRAAAIVGLNPLLIVYGVGGGHNDLLMLLALAAGIWALLAGRARTGGALSMLAIAIKLTAALVLPFALAAEGRHRGWAPRRSVIVGALAAGALIAALSVAVFGSGSFHLLATVTRSQSEGGWMSIQGAIADRLALPTLGRVVGYVLATGFVVICCRLLVAVWRGAIDWLDAAGWATLALLIAASSLLPWYVGWVLPLAALAFDRRLERAAIMMTGAVLGTQLLGYIPHA